MEQWLARRSHKPQVAGSNPAPATLSPSTHPNARAEAQRAGWPDCWLSGRFLHAKKPATITFLLSFPPSRRKPARGIFYARRSSCAGERGGVKRPRLLGRQRRSLGE